LSLLQKQDASFIQYEWALGLADEKKGNRKGAKDAKGFNRETYFFRSLRLCGFKNIRP